jgi:hypothetical protein
MKRNWFKSAGVLSMAIATTAVLPGCSAGDVESFDGESGEEGMSVDELELGTAEQGVMDCSNPDGANAAMAAFAVAIAKELGRWQTTKDFVIVRTNGISPNTTGTVEVLKLSSGSDLSGAKGSSRCAGGVCANVQALLDMQYDQAKGKVFFQGTGSKKVELVPTALRTRIVAKWREQEACDKNAKEPDSTACPKEEHALKFVSAAKGSCDTDFTFNVKQKDGVSALRYPSQLKHKLKFADPYNPYINFTPLTNGDFKIDPIYGLNPDGTTTTGTCVAACTKISTTSVAGSCCSCGGVNKLFAKSTFNANTFLCQ